MALDAMGGQNNSIENIELTLFKLSPGDGEGAGRFIVTKDGKVIVCFGREHKEMWKLYCEQTGSRNDKPEILAAGYVDITASIGNGESDWSSGGLKFLTPDQNRRKVKDFLKNEGGFFDMFKEWDRGRHI